MRITYLLCGLAMLVGVKASAQGASDEKLDLILKKLSTIEKDVANLSKVVNQKQSTETLIKELFDSEETSLTMEQRLNIEPEKMDSKRPMPDESAVDKALDEAFGSDSRQANEGSNSTDQEAGAVVPSADILALTYWESASHEVEYSPVRFVKINYLIKNSHNKKVVMIDGALQFDDKLQTRIGRIGIKRDLEIKPGESVSESGVYNSTSYGDGGLSRLLNIDPALVDVTLDIDQLLFADGTRLSFE